MSKYGYTGGRIRTPEELAKAREVDPFTLHAEQAELLRKQQKQQQQNFDQRFKGPIFKAKKQKWYEHYSHRIFGWKGLPFALGFIGFAAFWGPIFNFHRTRKVSDQEQYEHDLLVRKAFGPGGGGDTWYSFLIPYSGRYKELQRQDYLAQREEARKNAAAEE